MLRAWPPPPAAPDQVPPAWPLVPRTRGLCPHGGMWLLLSRLQVQPVTKLRMNPRDTDMDTQIQRTLTWLITQIATDKALPSTAPTYRTHIQHKHRQPSPLLLFSWQRQKVTSGGTHTPPFRFTSTHIFADPSSIGTAPLFWHPCPDPRSPYPPHGSPTCLLVQPDARCKHATLIHLSLVHSTLTVPHGHTSMDPPPT